MGETVGLLTFHNSNNNYGAVLQTYATYTVLSKMGYNPLIINLNFNKTKKKSSLLPTKQEIKDILIPSQFEKFRKKNLSQITREVSCFEDLANVSKNIKYFIVGSDQVWRPKFTKDAATNFFLDFVPSNANRIAYAPSFGIDKWEGSVELTSKIKSEIKKFKAISVREYSGVKICKNIFDVSAEHVLDPTMLLSQSDYQKLEVGEKSNNVSTKYIASYFVNDKLWKKDLTDQLADTAKFENIDIFGKDRSYIFKKYFIFKSISQWLKCIKNSEVVITDSYHCTIFSIIFRKKFIVLPNKWGGLARIEDLLSKFNLKNRLLEGTSVEDIVKLLNSDIDFDDVSKKISIEREKSLNFLKRALDSNM